MRDIAAPFVVAPPTGARITTRLHPTAVEEQALRTIGDYLGAAYRRTLSDRLETNLGSKEWRKVTKQALTADTSSRWAGALTRAAEDQYMLGMRAMWAHRRDLKAAIRAISKRLTLTPGAPGGYKDAAERHKKARRLAQHRAKLARVEKRLAAGRPSVVVGGKRLWRNRENLADASLTEAQWRERWDAERAFFTADGETGRRWGNETMRVTDVGVLMVKVPSALVEELGVARLVLEVPVAFTHRGDELQERIEANQAVRYDVRYDVEKGRWYLDASWHVPAPECIPTAEALASGRSLAIDQNGDHLAAWVIDAHGNPVGAPRNFAMDLADLPASTRDAWVRHCVRSIIKFARENECASITIENLNFADARATGRETMGRGERGKKFRRTVAGMPTAKFRDRLTSMAFHSGLWVIAVDPAYTSKWAKQYWLKPLKNSRHYAVTGHQAAAVVIGRRAKALRARRRPEGPARGQRTTSGFLKAMPDSVGAAAPSRARKLSRHPKAVSRTGDVGAARGRPSTVRGQGSQPPPLC